MYHINEHLPEEVNNGSRAAVPSDFPRLLVNGERVYNISIIPCADGYDVQTVLSGDALICAIRRCLRLGVYHD